MRIVYLITTLGHGKGGHFQSLKTISNELAKTNDVLVVNLGKAPSSVLEADSASLEFITLNKWNIFSVLKKLREIVIAFNPDVIHAFEVESYFFARMLLSLAKKNIFLNKCGGPNPKRYYPVADNLVLFSIENEQYFKKEKKYQNSKTFLIPQRVDDIKIDSERISKFQKEYKYGATNILRIARISSHYKSSIEQSINLLNALLNKVSGLHLIVLGTVQSDEVFENLKNYTRKLGLSAHVTFCTEEIYTHNASELLNLGDVVVGTGRNFMEASSLNKMLLVPLHDSKFPLLVTNENFEEVKSTNFSPRTVVKDYKEKENLKSILSAIGREQESRLWFERHFNVKVGAKNYLNAYENGRKPKRYLIDTFINYLYLRKHL